MNDDRKHLTQREVEKLIDTAPYGIPVALSTVLSGYVAGADVVV